MPRLPGLDAPGASDHLMSWGIARAESCREDMDRADCVARLAARCREGHLVVCAWARIPKHFTLLVRPGQSPRIRRMTKLRTMDGAIVNRRYRSSGQLVQKRVARQVVALAPLARHVSPGQGVAERRAWSGRRRPPLVCARRLVCQVAVQGRRYSGTGVKIPAVNRLAVSGALPEVRRYCKAL